MRIKDGNSAALTKELQKRINKESKLLNLAPYLNRMDELVKELEDSETLVLCTPLYVDGLPSQLIRFSLTRAVSRECLVGRMRVLLTSPIWMNVSVEN